MAPATAEPKTPPDRALLLKWSFETRQTASRWADLMRDMIPCATHMWVNLPQWTPKWSVTVVLRNSHTQAHEVRVLLWSEPTSDIRM